jgi:hypothetical protein
MNSVHRIHLREPWQTTALEDGRVRRSRRFGRPRRLDPHERVRLVIEAMPESGVVRVNGRELSGAAAGFRCDVTDLLHENNRVEIEASAIDAVGEVLLEIG